VSPYLARKGVEAEGCRWRRDGAIVLPLLRYDLPREQSLMGLQTILADGKKLFTPGLAKRGASLRLGLVEAGQPVLVCEGYATGLTLRMATERRLPVFVALDAGNLAHVVDVVQRVHAGCPVLICADDDWQTEGNPGVAAARAIAKRTPGVHVVYPVFPRGERGRKETDFNDLHARCGLVAVATQLRGPLRYLSEAKRAA
jgi:putative DNA primase/helicase